MGSREKHGLEWALELVRRRRGSIVDLARACGIIQKLASALRPADATSLLLLAAETSSEGVCKVALAAVQDMLSCGLVPDPASCCAALCAVFCSRGACEPIVLSACTVVRLFGKAAHGLFAFRPHVVALVSAMRPHTSRQKLSLAFASAIAALSGHAAVLKSLVEAGAIDVLLQILHENLHQSDVVTACCVALDSFVFALRDGLILPDGAVGAACTLVLQALRQHLDDEPTARGVLFTLQHLSSLTRGVGSRVLLEAGCMAVLRDVLLRHAGTVESNGERDLCISALKTIWCLCAAALLYPGYDVLVAVEGIAGAVVTAMSGTRLAVDFDADGNNCFALATAGLAKFSTLPASLVEAGALTIILRTIGTDVEAAASVPMCRSMTALASIVKAPEAADLAIASNVLPALFAAVARFPSSAGVAAAACTAFTKLVRCTSNHSAVAGHAAELFGAAIAGIGRHRRVGDSVDSDMSLGAHKSARLLLQLLDSHVGNEIADYFDGEAVEAVVGAVHYYREDRQLVTCLLRALCEVTKRPDVAQHFAKERVDRAIYSALCALEFDAALTRMGCCAVERISKLLLQPASANSTCMTPAEVLLFMLRAHESHPHDEDVARSALSATAEMSLTPSVWYGAAVDCRMRVHAAAMVCAIVPAEAASLDDARAAAASLAGLLRWAHTGEMLHWMTGLRSTFAADTVQFLLALIRLHPTCDIVVEKGADAICNLCVFSVDAALAAGDSIDSLLSCSTAAQDSGRPAASLLACSAAVSSLLPLTDVGASGARACALLLELLPKQKQPATGTTLRALTRACSFAGQSRSISALLMGSDHAFCSVAALLLRSARFRSPGAVLDAAFCVATFMAQEDTVQHFVGEGIGALMYCLGRAVAVPAELWRLSLDPYLARHASEPTASSGLRSATSCPEQATCTDSGKGQAAPLQVCWSKPTEINDAISTAGSSPQVAAPRALAAEPAPASSLGLAAEPAPASATSYYSISEAAAAPSQALAAIPEPPQSNTEEGWMKTMWIVQKFSEFPAARAPLMRNGAATKLVDMLEYSLVLQTLHNWHCWELAAKLLAHAFSAVRNLCASSEHRAALAAAGAGKLIIEALRRAAWLSPYGAVVAWHFAAIAWPAAGALFGLACDRGNCAALQAAGVAVVAAQLMRTCRHSESQLVQSELQVAWGACGVILKLAEAAEAEGCHDRLVSLLQNEGETLLYALRRGIRTPRIVSAACAALDVLAAARSNVLELQALGVVDAVRDCLAEQEAMMGASETPCDRGITGAGSSTARCRALLLRLA